MSEAVGFSTADYAVFISMLVVTSLIGVYYAIKDRNKKDVDNYQFGNSEVSPIAIGLSLAMSYVSATYLIGYPVDTYLYGTIMFWFALPSVIPCIIVCLYFIPTIHRLKLNTFNQYLEYRFNRKVRKFMSFYTIVTSIILNGVILYLPPLALEALTPLSFNASILITSALVTFYTAFGGIKAVIWTDTLQTLIMVAGVVAIFIRTVIVVGGFGKIWDALESGGRMNIMNNCELAAIFTVLITSIYNNWYFQPINWQSSDYAGFNLDPTIQRTFWTLFIGQTFSQTGLLGKAQSSVQRYRSCKSIKDARKALIIALMPMAMFTFICVLIGCAAYTYFANCDPIMNGEVRKYDQMIPLLVSKIFNDSPGMTGLFVAAVYSGALSNTSSGINSCGTMIVQDYILSFYPRLSQSAKTTISKITALCLAVLIAAIAFGFQFVGGTILTLTLSIFGCLSGPSFGVIVHSLFIPWTNSKGVIGGVVTAAALNVWIAVGSRIYGIPPDKINALPGSLSNCTSSTQYMTSLPLSNSSSTLIMNSISEFTTRESTTFLQQERPPLSDTLYALSFQYYFVFGFFVTLVFGLLISVITKPNSPSDQDPRFFVPIIDNEYLPTKVRKFFRFGVPEETKDQDELCKEDEIMSCNGMKERSGTLKSCSSFKCRDENECILTKL